MPTSLRAMQCRSSPTCGTSLFGTSAGFAHDARPGGELALQEAPEFVRSAAADVDAVARQALAHVLRFEDAHELAVETGDYRGRGSRGGEDSPPAGHCITGQAGFADRRYVGRC